ncbi:hypothetical protein PAPYR_6987 [Paratrimastix pyriformis]|uniref:Nitroreductase domain-containing protein n=1 Tax=Paratrimastix pyriformis TaxID=342808 RepID=A0ABQ8UE01_9EUKA|nr:hypothetical protein PAPYR_6987 [Paratrimastix pyriformis]|eukprot:GAFH01006249.1.p2 GENE.GAFH01006249.1~~GAFH01006249.1.p2  ORF type:complete len:163 (+),score=44.07 GAFH01006249.1:20-508(+)
MASTLDVIASRRSCRSFTSTPVPRDVIEKIVQAGAEAPCAMGRYPWTFTVVNNPETLARVNQETKKQTYGAPCVIFVGVNNGIPGYELFDAALACENICIAAQSLGLGSIILSYHYPTDVTPAVNTICGKPADHKICMGVAIGTANGPVHAHTHPAPNVTFH